MPQRCWRALAVYVISACGMAPSQSQETSLPPAYSAQIMIMNRNSPIAFASWVAYEGREASLTQQATSPYTSALDLKGGADGKEDDIETSLKMTAKLWRPDDELILRVELNSHFPVHMNRYRSDRLLEELPTNGSCSLGGDFEGVKDGTGWRFDLNLNPDGDCKASVRVQPMAIVERN